MAAASRARAVPGGRMSATVITQRVEGGTVERELREEHDARIVREKAEAAARELARHVANLLGMSAKHDRDSYLWNLGRTRGPAEAERVRDAARAAWKERRAAP